MKTSSGDDASPVFCSEYHKPSTFSMNAGTERRQIEGPAGILELAIDHPKAAAAGLAVLAHPHPLFGGSLDNKVVQTIARALLSRDMVCIRPNFRGVGGSQGTHDHGRGEQDDLWAGWAWAEAAYGATVGPKRWAAGFSFGASMTTHVVRNWQAERAARGLADLPLCTSVLVGLAVDRFPPAPIDERSHLIHGAQDDVVTLDSVFAFAAQYRRPVAVLPGAGHFFHGMLNELRDMVVHAVARD
ncbi:MAG: alpha/beta hydrolase [Burkholderiaceae bacterium]